MRLKKEYFRLYAITDRKWLRRESLLSQIEKALSGGVTCLQLREKNMSEDDFVTEARGVKVLCHRYGVPLIINDSVSVALKSGADGVHIGQDDMSLQEARRLCGDSMIIGVSAHNTEEAITAEQNGASYLGSGAVFGSSTKTDAHLLSIAVLKEIAENTSVPVVAIGGINKENIKKLSGTGIDGVALISAVFAAEDIKSECIILNSLIDKYIISG